MVVRLLLVAVGALHLLNGLFMLFAPGLWYATVPGVPMTGPFNPHFVLDIGMAFVASGAGLVLGARSGRNAAVLACAGATWPALHALIHVQGWAAHGMARGTEASEIVGVGVVSTLGVVLAWLRVRGERS